MLVLHAAPFIVDLNAPAVAVASRLALPVIVTFQNDTVKCGAGHEVSHHGENAAQPTFLPRKGRLNLARAGFHVTQVFRSTGGRRNIKYRPNPISQVPQAIKINLEMGGRGFRRSFSCGEVISFEGAAATESPLDCGIEIPATCSTTKLEIAYRDAAPTQFGRLRSPTCQ